MKFTKNEFIVATVLLCILFASLYIIFVNSRQTVRIINKCKIPDYNIALNDKAGNVVALGNIDLPSSIPPVGISFQGACKLNVLLPDVDIKSDLYEGNVHANEVVIDLNPGIADNNIILKGTISGRSLGGNWYKTSIAGAKEMGTFRSTPK